MTKKWTKEEILDVVRGFQPACVVSAAADLNIFTILNTKPTSAEAVADKLQADTRAVTILLDALAAMALLTSQNKEYSLSSDVAELLTEDGGRSWTNNQKQKPGGYRSCVVFVPGTISTYIAIGRGGSDITTDDGKSWTPLNSNGYFCLNIEKTGRVGWAAGADGQIARMTLLKQ